MMNAKLVKSAAQARAGAPRPTHAALIADCLQWAVVHRRYRPGEPLREQALADEYGVSRTVIRDVIARLSQRGLVEVHPNRGAQLVRFTPEELSDILDVNARIRGAISRLAAARGDTAGFAALKKRAERLSKCARAQDSSDDDFLDLRISFIDGLIDLTGPFRAVSARVAPSLNTEHQCVLTALRTAAQKRADADHAASLARLISARREQEAEAETIAHLTAQRDAVIEALRVSA